MPLRSLLIAALAATALSACDSLIAPAPASTKVSPTSASDALVSLLGRAVGVTDGDTLTLLDDDNRQHTIRLAEIDAPERGQPWGRRARETLSSLVDGKRLSVQQTDSDRWGRIVARVFADDVDINRAMVEQGAAWAYREYLTDRTLLDIERQARQRQMGLWATSDRQPIPPWEWRDGRRAPSASGLAPAAVSQRPRGLLSQPGLRSSPTGFTCGDKRYCRQMTSCQEAQFYLNRCGVSSLDGNGDGEPCELLCGTTRR